MKKNSKLILIAVAIIPWLTIPLMKKQDLKRFYPSALFMAFFIMGESFLAKKEKWWEFYNKLHPNMMGELPLICGPFFVGSLWILKATYGHFLKYLTLNVIVDSLFSFGVVKVFQKARLVTLHTMKEYQLLLLCLTKATLMYGFQSLIESKQ
ncbi:hypothetical protein [Bacillus alkalicellulosilyticus]|uniref:hypothetical protein n=1 Tax=Alkalihalobacterium alkalicellulosilyticum TaxID=1912214 RepID=UPI0009974826|nr:hypothetical protein [Bacillus alkalicellulosilyticus]